MTLPAEISLKAITVGLSFESILADVRGDIKEKPAAPAGGGKSSARAKKKQAVVAKKKPAATKKKNREARAKSALKICGAY